VWPLEWHHGDWALRYACFGLSQALVTFGAYDAVGGVSTMFVFLQSEPRAARRDTQVVVEIVIRSGPAALDALVVKVGSVSNAARCYTLQLDQVSILGILWANLAEGTCGIWRFTCGALWIANPRVKVVIRPLRTARFAIATGSQVGWLLSYRASRDTPPSDVDVVYPRCIPEAFYASTGKVWGMAGRALWRP
jgi:hypothetical protein